MSQKSWALRMVAAILIGLRMMPGFFIARSMRFWFQRAIVSGSKPSNSSRIVSRLRRMVIHESPA